MSEFTFLFRGDTTVSADQMQKTIEKWDAWMKELGAKGHIKEPGRPLERTGKVVKGKLKAVNDGPYSQAQDLVGGYMVIDARDIAHAVEISKGCPILDGGGSVEVRPTMKMVA